jgi:hypothetical protein
MDDFLGLNVFVEGDAAKGGSPRVFDCLIAGSGAAAFNAALHLFD